MTNMNTPIVIGGDGDSVSAFISLKLDDAGDHISEFSGDIEVDGYSGNIVIDMDDYRETPIEDRQDFVVNSMWSALAETMQSVADMSESDFYQWMEEQDWEVAVRDMGFSKYKSAK